MALSSICASACSRATRFSWLPPALRLGMSRGRSRSGRSGRAGRVGGLPASSNAACCCFQSAASARARATLSAGSAANRISHAPCARSIIRFRQLLHFLQHLVDMARHLHLAPDVPDHALAVDQEGRALDAHVFPAIHALLDPDAVILRHLAGLVRAEGEVELVLLLELVVAFHAVARDADHGRVDLAELRQAVAEAAGLRGAARGIVLGIEIEHNVLSLEPGQRDLAAAVGLHGKRRCLVANLQCHGRSLSENRRHDATRCTIVQDAARSHRVTLSCCHRMTGTGTWKGSSASFWRDWRWPAAPARRRSALPPPAPPSARAAASAT